MDQPFYIKNYCHIKEEAIQLDGDVLFKMVSPDLASFLKSAYQHFEIDYSKFFKMDRLSKLAFMAAEVLLKTPATSFEKAYLGKASREKSAFSKPSEGDTSSGESSSIESSPENQNTAIVLSNRASSLDTDRKYQESISDLHNFYPSPAVFVYTLPNICIGEISIRHRLRSENSFFIFDAFNAGFLKDYAESLLDTGKADEVLCGWVDVDENHYEAFLYLVSPTGNIPHTEQEITELYQTP
ncbi:MAG: 3-oxoacyl-ACP synthase [Pricia sp.]